MDENQSHRNIFIASFFTLIAAGMGFGIRGGILGAWGDQFGFTKTDLGTITGGGLVGFGVTIIFCSIFADRLGYKPILALAFVLHVASALITLAATPLYNSMLGSNSDGAKNAAYWCLYIGMFMFALANGLCEAVINPLVATLYPTKKTHYLNILHAGWPAGLVIGGLVAYCFAGENPAVQPVRWEILMALFLVPTLLYGVLTLKESFPLSEARKAGIRFSEMLKQFASPLLLLLLLIHAMVGYVELGTDSWITNITQNVIAEKAFLLFVYTSMLMFILRFFAGPIVERINPLGLLCFSAILGACGLTLLGIGTTVAFMFFAATVYALGKTFLWPTMLGVAGERFPKGGALTMGTMGGIGMLSAGLLGGPGIGYNQDYFASKNLQEESESTYKRFVSPEKNHFLFFPAINGLDGKKVGELKDRIDAHDKAVAKAEAKEKLTPAEEKALEPLTPEQLSDEKFLLAAQMYGGRWALRCTAAVPATMAVLYLGLVIYFGMKGGYKPVHITDVEGPSEY
jgi:MFS family permease